MSAFNPRMSRTLTLLCISLITGILSVDDRLVSADQPVGKNDSKSASIIVPEGTISADKGMDNELKSSRGSKGTQKGWTSATKTQPARTPKNRNVVKPLASSAPKRSEAQAAAPSKTAIKTVSAETPHSDESHTATQVPPAESQTPTEESGLSATERVKRALAAQHAAGNPHPVANDEVGASSPFPRSLVGVNPATEDGTAEIDPLELEKAQRFLKLKMQLMQLKSRIKSPGELASGHSELSPSASDHSDSEHGTTEPRIEFYSPKERSNDGHVQNGHSVGHHEEASDPSLHEKAVGHDQPQSADHETSPPESGHESESHKADSHAPALSEADHTHGDSQHDSGDGHDSSALTGHGDEHGSAHGDSSTMPGNEVVEGPIDRLGLANNLYAVGEYQLALRMYEHVEMSELSAQQQIWAEYQAANCLRRLGKSGEASNRYRKIAGQPEAGWLSEQSRWWVDTLERIRQLEKSLEEDIEKPADEAPVTPFAGVRSDIDHSDHHEPQGTAHPVPESGEAKHGEH